MSAPRLLFVVNDPGFFVSHRLVIAEAARDAGYHVGVATMDGPAVGQIRGAGLEHHCLRMTRSGQNPLYEVLAYHHIFRVLRRVRPDIAHLVTIKPVVYGGIAARRAGVPAVVSAISGLGFLFSDNQSMRRRVSRRLVKFLYRWALGHPNQRVVVQNLDDRDVLERIGALDRCKATLVKGAGVDLADYRMEAEPAGVPTVVMAARLLRAKGVEEFIAAARLLIERGVRARFQLVGAPDPGNPGSITNAEWEKWSREGPVECLGFRKDMQQIFAGASVVVLPSYYGEGLPKVLIEAASSGRPIVTTNIPGCRDAIVPGQSGILVEPRNVGGLASAIQRLVDDPELRDRMGKAGRALAEREFAIEAVVSAHLKIYEELLGAT